MSKRKLGEICFPQVPSVVLWASGAIHILFPQDLLCFLTFVSSVAYGEAGRRQASSGKYPSESAV